MAAPAEDFAKRLRWSLDHAGFARGRGRASALALRYGVSRETSRKWLNGMDDEEMHNLYPAILNKQMSLGFEEYTGRRSMIYSSGGYTGIQRYSATWAGDTGGGPKSLVSMLNHGLSGHSNTSCDMDVFTAEGIHCGFFQTWSQLSSWAYWRHPWFLTKPLKETFRFYANLRNQLIPYIYTAAHQASTAPDPFPTPTRSTARRRPWSISTRTRSPRCASTATVSCRIR